MRVEAVRARLDVYERGGGKACGIEISLKLEVPDEVHVLTMAHELVGKEVLLTDRGLTVIGDGQ
jgi:hypothetical protein